MWPRRTGAMEEILFAHLPPAHPRPQPRLVERAKGPNWPLQTVLSSREQACLLIPQWQGEFLLQSLEDRALTHAFMVPRASDRWGANRRKQQRLSIGSSSRSRRRLRVAHARVLLITRPRSKLFGMRSKLLSSEVRNMQWSELVRPQASPTRPSRSWPCEVRLPCRTAQTELLPRRQHVALLACTFPKLWQLKSQPSDSLSPFAPYPLHIAQLLLWAASVRASEAFKAHLPLVCWAATLTMQVTLLLQCMLGPLTKLTPWTSPGLSDSTLVPLVTTLPT